MGICNGHIDPIFANILAPYYGMPGCTIPALTQRIPDWTHCNAKGDVIAQTGHDTAEAAQTYAEAWNECATRAERIDLIIYTIDGRDDTTIIVRTEAAPW